MPQLTGRALRRWSSMAAILLASSSLSSLAAAQTRVEAPGDSQAEVDELVITYRVGETAGGTRIVTPLKDLPMSVQVVNEDLIKDLGARKLGDAIRFVSGITKVNRNANMGQNEERFAIRGFNSGLVLRNGVPYNVASDTANIQQIDVIKGANSILYGFNDPGGLINYVTKTPLETARYSASQAIGTFDYFRTEVDFTGPLSGGLGYRLTGAYTDTGSHLENGKEQILFVNPVVEMKLGERTSLILDYDYRKSDTRYQRDAYPMLRNAAGTYIGYADAGSRFSQIFPDDRNHNEASNLELRLTHHFTDDMTLRVVAAQTRTDIDMFNMIGFTMDPGQTRLLPRRNLLEKSKGKTNFAFADFSTRFETPFMSHRVVMGGQHLRSETQSFSRTGAFAPAVDILNPSSDPAVRYRRMETYAQLSANPVWVKGVPTETIGVFATDQITLADDRTHILLGVRYDDLEVATNVTPQIGVSYALSPQLSLYALYSESFRPNPTITLQSREVLTFDPETGVSYEGGLKFDLLGSRLSGTLAVFELTRQNVLQTTANAFDPLRPIISLSGEERSRGIELDVSGRVTDRLKVFGSFSHTKAKVISNADPAVVGLPLEGAAPNALSVFASYDVGRVAGGELSANLGVIWRDGPIYQYNTLVYRALVTPSYTVVDAGVDWALDNDLTFSLKTTNLFDEVYMDRRGAYAAPRAVNLFIRKTF